MSTNGYTDCVDGTFYGFTDTENNEFYPGQSLNLQWGAIDNGTLPLNISLGRVGGALVDQIVTDVTFSTTSSLYQIVSNTTANCTLEQYTWAIPSDFDVSNPKYQIGLFDGGAIRGDNNNGWRSWSPAFYVREKNSAISASMTATTTGLLTATAQTSATVTATPTTTTSSSSATATTSSSNHNSSGSSSTAVGVGVGVGVGCAALIAAGAFWFIWRRRRGKRGTRLDEDGRPGESVELPVKPVQELGGGVIDSKGKIPLGPQEAGGQGITKIRGLHEME